MTAVTYYNLFNPEEKELIENAVHQLRMKGHNENIRVYRQLNDVIDSIELHSFRGLIATIQNNEIIIHK